MKWKLLPASELARHEDAWDRVNASRGDVPFLRGAFIGHLLREFSSGLELLAVCADGAAEQALGILVPKGKGVWETYQPSQLPLGAWVTRPGFDLDRGLAALIRALPGFGMMIGLTQQDPGVLERPTDGGRWQTLDYIDTAWIDVGGSFDAFWDARGKNLRTNMRKQRAKLEGDGVQARLEVVSQAGDVAQAIADYGRLEGAGWKGADGTAIQPDNAQGRFYRAMLEEFSRHGAARIYRYRFNDQVVAVDLCVESAAVQVVLKTTYDESFKTVSPSSLMRQDAVRQIFTEARVKRIEFYGRVMEWHTRWTDRKRTLFHANRYRWSVLRRLRGQMSGAVPTASSEGHATPQAAPPSAER